MHDIREYLLEKGVDIVREDGTELACYCPFHANKDTPAFYINKKTGLWICFNPGCGKRGSMRDLMEFFGDKKSFHKDIEIDDIIANLSYREKVEHDNSWDETLEKIIVKLPDDADKVSYLINRGFDEETIEHFEIGYSQTKKRIVIPVRNELFKMVGFIGRAVEEGVQPKYLYSKGFPRKDVLFNLNNAKKFGSVIVVEGSLDAMRVHQAGFPNVVATLGAAVTEEHGHLLNRYFDKIFIFSDNDQAGWTMRDLIINLCNGKEIYVAKYPGLDIKDPGMMSDEQIIESLENSREYLSWMLKM